MPGTAPGSCSKRNRHTYHICLSEHGCPALLKGWANGLALTGRVGWRGAARRPCRRRPSAAASRPRPVPTGSSRLPSRWKRPAARQGASESGEVALRAVRGPLRGCVPRATPAGAGEPPEGLRPVPEQGNSAERQGEAAPAQSPRRRGGEGLSVTCSGSKESRGGEGQQGRTEGEPGRWGMALPEACAQLIVGFFLWIPASVIKSSFTHQKEPWFWELVVTLCLRRDGRRSPRGPERAPGWEGDGEEQGRVPRRDPPQRPGAGLISQCGIYEVRPRSCRGCDIPSRGCRGVPGTLCSQGACQGRAEPLGPLIEMEDMRDTWSHHLREVLLPWLWRFWDAGDSGIQLMAWEGRARGGEGGGGVGASAAWKDCPAKGGRCLGAGVGRMF